MPHLCWRADSCVGHTMATTHLEKVAVLSRRAGAGGGGENCAVIKEIKKGETKKKIILKTISVLVKRTLLLSYSIICWL